MSSTFVTIALLAISAATLAAEARVGRLVLSVPPQFKGPTTAAPDTRTSMVAYAATATPGAPAAVLQISRVAGDGPPPNMSDAELTRITSQYLLQMLGGIERARSGFARASPESVRLGGQVASKVSWTGNLHGAPTNGIMYCTIVGSDLVWLHAFGPGNQPDAATSQAISAIEALNIMPAGKSLERAREK